MKPAVTLTVAHARVVLWVVGAAGLVVEGRCRLVGHGDHLAGVHEARHQLVQLRELRRRGVEPRRDAGEGVTGRHLRVRHG